MENQRRTIERAKQELEQMIDLNPQVMLLVDRRGTVMRTNRALLDLLGFSGFHEVLGRRLGDIFPGSDAVVRLPGGKGGCNVHETEVILPDRRKQLLQFTVVDAGKEPDFSVVIVRNVSGEKERAAHLEKEHKKEAINALVGALMHNLNQSLTVIMIQAELMHIAIEKDSAHPDELKNSLQNILSHTAQIADTLKNVEKTRDFVTQPYIAGVEILDIKRSGGEPRKSEKGPARPASGAPERPAMAVINALLSALDAHEPGAMLHARRVAEYAAVIAGRMGLADKETEIVRRCALLHDIGKIGIPDAILQKPGPLTDPEMNMMKKHTVIGYDLLISFPFPINEAEAARSHHEWYNGAGYPQGLAGRNIHPYARIIAVADSFDVLRFGRSYHAAMPMESAGGEIIAGAGAQFDPEVVRVFDEYYREPGQDLQPVMKP